MQPTCRQVPPRNPSFSITRVFSPHCAARMAVTYPPGPLPMIARSYLGKSNLRGRLTVRAPLGNGRRDAKAGPLRAARSLWAAESQQKAQLQFYQRPPLAATIVESDKAIFLAPDAVNFWFCRGNRCAARGPQFLDIA